MGAFAPYFCYVFNKTGDDIDRGLYGKNEWRRKYCKVL